MLCKPLFIV